MSNALLYAENGAQSLASYTKCELLSLHMVSYSDSRTISGRILNHRTVVEELDVTRGSEGMDCDCSSNTVPACSDL